MRGMGAAGRACGPTRTRGARGTRRRSRGGRRGGRRQVSGSPTFRRSRAHSLSAREDAEEERRAAGGGGRRGRRARPGDSDASRADGGERRRRDRANHFAGRRCASRRRTRRLFRSNAVHPMCSCDSAGRPGSLPAQTCGVHRPDADEHREGLQVRRGPAPRCPDSEGNLVGGGAHLLSRQGRNGLDTRVFVEDDPAAATSDGRVSGRS